MKLTKRSFLGLMGGAAVTGPKALPVAAKAVGLDDIYLKGITSHGAALAPTYEIGGPSSEWAAGQLAKMMAKSVLDLEWEKKTTEVYNLTPNVAGLKSVSLGHKIRMVRNETFVKNRERRMEGLQRRIMGLNDD